MKVIFVTLVAVLVYGGLCFDQLLPKSSLPNEELVAEHFLPNSCAITATEAFARLRPTGVWVRMMWIVYSDPTGTYGHMLTVWQPFAGSQVFVYDIYLINATSVTYTHSRNAKDVITALNDSYSLKIKQTTILSGDYIQ